MTYPANLFPSTTELAAGSLEPTSNAFKNAVMIRRTAPLLVISQIITFYVAGKFGVVPIVGDWLAFSVFTAGFYFVVAAACSIAIRRTRRPSEKQIRYLADLVRLDPSLARKVNALTERDYTFAKMQKFIVKNAGRANEVLMARAIADLEAAVAGK